MNDDTLTPAEQAVLMDFVNGVRDGADADVQQLLARQPEQRARAEELRRLALALAHSGAEQRQVVAEARGGVTEGDLALAREFVRRHEGELHRPRRLWRVVAAAAALLVVALGLWLWWQGQSAERARRDQTRMHGRSGSSRLEVESAGDAVFGRFRWTVQVEPGGWYEVQVYAVRDGQRDAPDPVISLTVEEPLWQPNSEHRAILRQLDAIRWTVTPWNGSARGKTEEAFAASR